ncbi:MAG: VWA domain-containing protein [Edaphobacter sp.]
MLRSLKYLPGLALSASLLFVPASAQTPQTGQSSATPKPSSSSLPTLHASTQLVVVDVVVTDKNRKPVHGLKASDFTLTEENAPQTIKHFEEHTALTAADATKFPAMPTMPPGIFTNFTPEPVNGAVNVLLFDVLNTPVTAQQYVRQQLLAYLNSAAPGTRIAIFGLTTHLIILQGFTTDPAVLKAIASKRFGKTSPLLQDAVGGSGIQNSQADDMEDMGLPADIVANVRQFETETQSNQVQLRVKYTLDAMNQLARYLSSIPGRKNLIWFSGSFPISILPDTSIKDPFVVVANSESEFRDTVNLFARSQVAVYPVDARGLVTSPVDSAATTRNYGRNPGRMTQDLNKFAGDTADEHNTMDQMAEGTGGRAFYNTNGLSQAIASALDEGSNFYTLTYTPANPDRDGKFRKIKVQSARKGVSLTYRRGYYADDPDKAPSHLKSQPKQSTVTDAAVTSSAANTQQSMRAAMMRGSPTPSDIVMKVGVYPTVKPAQSEDKPAAGNVLTEKTRGPFRSYNITYAINPTDITFLRTPDGKIHADFELVIFVYDPDGVLVNHLVTELHIASSLEEIRKNVAHGIQYSQQISAPAKGQYFLRIAVHDLNRDHYGVVEVATSDVNNLAPPLPPPMPASSVTPATTTSPAPQ